MISKAEFIDDVKRAVENRIGYSAGKIGNSEKQWMCYPVLAEQANPRKGKALELVVSYHCRSAGIYPLDPAFYLRFNEFYIEHVRRLDCLGILPDMIGSEHDVVRRYRLTNKLTHFLNQEPDRSVPTRADACYLQHFLGKRLLLICPFAELLKARATQATFEGVWSRIGKRWFHPASVEALEFPYGFVALTQARYPTVLDLYTRIAAEIERRDFDVALIAAAGLGIPIASKVKQLGKVGLSLGGHLQVLFGVIGKRWRDQPEWRDQYFNEWWIDMPVERRPSESEVCDGGSYW